MVQRNINGTVSSLTSQLDLVPVNSSLKTFLKSFGLNTQMFLNLHVAIYLSFIFKKVEQKIKQNNFFLVELHRNVDQKSQNLLVIEKAESQ